MRIAVFGGTFDPVHKGHTGPGRFLLDSGRADRIVYLPAWCPPHKGPERVTPYVHRRAMLALALDPDMEISDLEKERSGKSYTIDTLKILTERHPSDTFFWVVGADGLRNLHFWHRAEELVRGYSFLVLPRPGEAMPDREELGRHWPGDLIGRLLSFVVEGSPLFTGSSTEIRRAISRGRTESVRGLLDPAVLNYICEHKLYREERKNE